MTLSLRFYLEFMMLSIMLRCIADRERLPTDLIGNLIKAQFSYVTFRSEGRVSVSVTIMREGSSYDFDTISASYGFDTIPSGE